MLRSLTINNLKSFGTEQTIPLAPITLIYGPNSAGKTTIIQSLLLLKQTLESADPQDQVLVVRGPLVDMGSFKSLLHRHDLELDLTLGLSFDRPPYRAGRRFILPGMSRYKGTRHAKFAFRWSRKTESVELRSSTLAIADSPAVSFQWRRRLGDSEPTGRRSLNQFTLPARERARFADFCLWLARQRQDTVHSHEVKRAVQALSSETGLPVFYATGLLPGGVSEVEVPGSQVEDARSEHRRRELVERFAIWDLYARGLRYELDQIGGNVAYLGPLRHAPQRFHVFSGALRRNVGAEGEFATEVLARHQQLLARVNAWLEQLEIPYRLDVRRLSDDAVGGTIGDVISLVLHDRRNGVPVAPNDVGFGISQLLPIVVQALFGEQTVICVEQPEIHVHPALQAEIADLLIDSSIQSSKNQFIIETHSEHLMLRLQRRIREGTLSPKSVSVVYVQPEADGSSHAIQLRLGERGEFLDEWPSGFFEERFVELFGRP